LPSAGIEGVHSFGSSVIFVQRAVIMGNDQGEPFLNCIPSRARFCCGARGF
jgi:hypothetical protein